MLTINQFLPKYCSVLLRDDYREYVSEIIIEGHTDTNGSYIYNLRTFTAASVLSGKVLSDGEQRHHKQWTWQRRDAWRSSSGFRTKR